MSTTVKYQVFVSSTYEDLKDERDQVVKAILEMGHIPVGMEMFSAADEEQWSIIQRHIEASDYYVVIVAHRYGSTVDGVSYTEKEYDHALNAGVPALGFIINDEAGWAETRRDTGPNSEEMRAKLVAFKSKVRQKPVQFWSNAAELHGKVAISLTKTMTARPRVGWIPASQAASAEAAAELARLSKENAALRDSIEQLRQTSGLEARAAEVAEELREYQIEFPNATAMTGATVAPPTNALEMFEAIGPSLAGGAGLIEMLTTLEQKYFGAQLEVTVNQGLQRILFKWLKELIIQDLISRHKDQVHGMQGRVRSLDRWELTEFGRAFLRFRRRMLE